MIFSIPKGEILSLLKKQLSVFFTIDNEELNILEKCFEPVLMRCESCFIRTSSKYFKYEQQAYFNPFMSVQYMIFLYYFSNEIFRLNSGHFLLCDKLYYLNKIMNSLDLFYAVEMPSFFMAEHPVGSVIGRAKIKDGFMFYQACTIGGTHQKDGTIKYPILGENVHLYANSAIIGNCLIGDNVKIGAGALVKNQDISANSVVFGSSPNLIIKSIK